MLSPAAPGEKWQGFDRLTEQPGSFVQWARPCKHVVNVTGRDQLCDKRMDKGPYSEVLNIYPRALNPDTWTLSRDFHPLMQS